MIGKITSGKDFKGSIDYDAKLKVSRDLVSIIDSNVFIPLDENCTPQFDIQVISDQFDRQSQLRPLAEKPVRHVALSFEPQDAAKLSPEIMRQISRDYLEMMGYSNTQYVTTEHGNTSNPHIHITINRVDNNGELIQIKNEKKKNAEVCRTLTEKYNLAIGHWKGINDCEIPLNSDERISESARYEIAVQVTKALTVISNIDELPDALLQQHSGVQSFFKKNENGKDELWFVRCEIKGDGKDDVRFLKCTDVDKRFSINNLEKALDLKQDYPDMISEIRDAWAIIDKKQCNQEIRQTLKYLDKKINQEPWAGVASKEVGYIPLYLEVASHDDELRRLLEYSRNLAERRVKLQNDEREIKVRRI